MTEQCSEIERIAKIEADSVNVLSVVREFKDDFKSFKKQFIGSVLAVIVTVFIAIYYTGYKSKTIDDNTTNIAVLEEKVSAIEDVVFIHGVYERKE